MKHNHLVTFLPAIMVLVLALSCKKDSIQQGPPAIVVATQPAITSISPDSGTVNTVVTIAGKNFKTNLSDDTVKFNGVTATVTSATATQLVVNAPATGTTGNVTVTTSEGTSNGIAFTYATGHDDVYIVGQDGGYVAMWKNGVETAMGTGAAGRAWAIFVSGADVYIVGNENNAGMYWKNGVPVSLPGCIVATGITVVGQTVYVLGERQYVYFGNPTTVAAVWQNGVIKDVAQDTTINSVAGGLVYAQTDLFTSAWYYKQVLTTTSTVIQTRAFYYPPYDGILNYLTDDKTNSWTTCMAASPGGSVLVGGYVDGGAAVWADGLPLWQDNLQSTSQCYGVASNDTFISVVGHYVDQVSHHTRAFVINIGVDNSYTVLNSGADANYNAEATGVAIDGNDVYVSGFNANDGPVYWKNGVKAILPHSGTAEFCGAYAIFIKKN